MKRRPRPISAGSASPARRPRPSRLPRLGRLRRDAGRHGGLGAPRLRSQDQQVVRAVAVTAVLGWTDECWGLAGSGAVPCSPRTSRRRKRIPGRCGPGSESARLNSDPFAVLPFASLRIFAPLPRPGSQDPAVWEEEGAAGAGGQLGTAPQSPASASPSTGWAWEGAEGAGD